MATTKRKQLILTTNSLSRMWLTLLSGLTGFTEREIDVLELLINKRNDLVAGGVKSPYLNEMLFSTTSRKEYHSTLGISEYNFTNLLGTLRKKKGIISTEEGEDIDPRLICAEEMVIKFIVNEEGTSDSETTSE